MLWSTVYGVHRPARCFFFFNDTATTEIYTLSLHDALPISLPARLPYQITERERSLTVRLYGGASDINWMQYGEGGGATGTDPLVTRMTYAQPAGDEVMVTIELARVPPPGRHSTRPKAR